MTLSSDSKRALWRSLAGLGALALFPLFVGDREWLLATAFFVLLYAVLATAWNIVAGYLGYISLAVIAFFGLGAYTIGNLANRVNDPTVADALLLIPVAGLLVALMSIPLGLIAYRTRGAAFILVTIAFVFMFQYMAFNLADLTGGAQGFSLPSISYGPGYEAIMYLVILGVLALAVLVCWYLMASPLGLAMYAVRDDEEKAQGLGIGTTFPKLTAFAVSSGIAGMAGAAWALRTVYIYPQFAFDTGVLLVAMVLMALFGGLGTLWGPTLGALLLAPLEQTLRYELGGDQYYLLVYVAVFIAVMLMMPRGILPTVADWLSRGRRSHEAAASGSAHDRAAPDLRSRAEVGQ